MKPTRCALALCALVVLACSSTAPAVKRAPVPHRVDEPFPPVGAVSLAAAPPPKDGALYQIVLYYEGRNEVTLTGARSYDEPQMTTELLQLELDYREIPVSAPSEDTQAASLVLDALRRRLQTGPPNLLHTVEAGDDRVRVSRNDKVEVDLRGAQPKGDMTPRSILNKPFALLVTDDVGTPKGVTLRGIPSAKKMLSAMPLRDVIGYLQVTRPEEPVSPGATWTSKRFPASPIGHLGVGMDVEYRLVGYEMVENVPCAHVSIRAERDEKNAATELGLPMEDVRIQLGGDAWIELHSGLVRTMRIEDIAAVIYERKGAGSVGARVRSRYETRASLRHLDLKTTTETWADGTKRFAEVK